MAPSIEQQLNAPALAPPPGVIPRFSPNPHLPWVIPVSVIITVIPGLLLISRFYTKFRIIRKTDATEYIALTGFLLFLSMVIIGNIAKQHGAGQHQWNLYRYNLNNVLYWFNILEILYCPTIYMVKLAILLQYLYLLAPLGTQNRPLQIGSWILIVANLIYYIISASISAAACSPRAKIWNDLLPGKCLDNNIAIMFTSIWNILSDIAILALPAHTVWKLRISTKKKLQLTFLFGIGLLAIIANAFIIWYLLQTTSPTADVSHYLLFVGLWATVEICIGLIVVSALTLPKMIEAKGKRLTSAISRTFTIASSPITSLFTHASTLRSRNGSVEERAASNGGFPFDAELTTTAVGASKPEYGGAIILTPIQTRVSE